MNNKIGVSIACYLPLSAFFTEKATRWAKGDGFAFIGMLPFRGLKRTVPSLPIRYAEGAWNPVKSLREALSGQPTDQGMVPNIADLLFFPNPQRSQELLEAVKNRKPSPLTVVHSIEEWRAGQLLEVSPRVNMRITPFLCWIRKNNAGLVLDTHHLRRSVWRHTGEVGMKLDDWGGLLPLLLPFTKLIHVQPKDQYELSAIMRGRKTELHQMLLQIKGQGFTGDFMVEATLGAKGIMLWKLREMLRSMRQFVADNAF